MTARAARKGQPLVVLCLLLGSWVAARGVILSDAFLPEADRIAATAPVTDVEASVSANTVAAGVSSEAWPSEVAPSEAPGWTAPAMPLTWPEGQRPAPLSSFSGSSQNVRGFGPDAAIPGAAGDRKVRQAIGHQVLWMAALSHMPVPEFVNAAPAPRSAGAPFAEPHRAKRWSGDGWLLLREGGGAGGLAAAPGAPTYGASQIGAVARYRLGGSKAAPTAYVRATAALNGTGEREVAAGFSVRPVSGIPVVAAAEGRVSERPGRTEVRPAAMLVTQLPPADLPGGLRGEAYAQGGYVGGRDATFFADGQVRVDKRIAGVGEFDLRAGLGAWGGAQEGAARLDAGPTATLGVPISQGASARLGIDWRVRIAGDATPGSGPALTLSAGF